MRKQDLEAAIKALEEIREGSSKLDYNTSVAINQRLIKVTPLLESELCRLNKENINAASPVLMEITQKDCDDVHKSMQDYINDTLLNLAENEVTILDFGIVYNVDSKYGYIKYDRK